jgi:hypothetical protein
MKRGENATLPDDVEAVEEDADALDEPVDAVADDAAALEKTPDELNDQDTVWDDAAKPLKGARHDAAAGADAPRADAQRDGALPADAERLLAASLALMTSFYRCPHTAVCRKLVDNLMLLSQHPRLSESLRAVCRNAEARWGSYLEEIEQALAQDDDDDEAASDGDDVVPTPQSMTLH